MSYIEGLKRFCGSIDVQENRTRQIMISIAKLVNKWISSEMMQLCLPSLCEHEADLRRLYTLLLGACPRERRYILQNHLRSLKSANLCGIQLSHGRYVLFITHLIN